MCPVHHPAVLPTQFRSSSPKLNENLSPAQLKWSFEVLILTWLICRETEHTHGPPSAPSAGGALDNRFEVYHHFLYQHSLGSFSFQRITSRNETLDLFHDKKKKDRTRGWDDGPQGTDLYTGGEGGPQDGSHFVPLWGHCQVFVIVLRYSVVCLLLFSHSVSVWSRFLFLSVKFCRRRSLSEAPGPVTRWACPIYGCMLHDVTLTWIMFSFWIMLCEINNNNVNLLVSYFLIIHTADPLSPLINMALSVCTYLYTDSHDDVPVLLLLLTHCYSV